MSSGLEPRIKKNNKEIMSEVENDKSQSTQKKSSWISINVKEETQSYSRSRPSSITDIRKRNHYEENNKRKKEQPINIEAQAL